MGCLTEPDHAPVGPNSTISLFQNYRPADDRNLVGAMGHRAYLVTDIDCQHRLWCCLVPAEKHRRMVVRLCLHFADRSAA